MFFASLILIAWCSIGMVCFVLVAADSNLNLWRYFALVVLGGPLVWLYHVFVFFFVIAMVFFCWVMGR